MSLSPEATMRLRRLLDEYRAAVLDPKLRADAAALTRWALYVEGKVAQLVEEECERRQRAPAP